MEAAVTRVSLCRSLLFLLAWGPLALAQEKGSGDPPDDIPDPLDTEAYGEWLEKARAANEAALASLENSRRDAETDIAWIGNTEPWPPADPEFLSADAWRAAVLAAPRLGSAQLLERFEKVRVAGSQTPDVAALYDEPKQIFRQFVDASNDAGMQTHSNSDLELFFGITLKERRLDLPSGPSVPASLLWINVGLQLPARVLRGEAVHDAMCVVEQISFLAVSTRSPTRDEIGKALGFATKGLFERIEAGAAWTPVDSGHWKRWLADPERAAERFATYQGALVDNVQQLDPGTAHTTGLRTIVPRISGAQLVPEIGEELSGNALQSTWTADLQARGMDTAQPTGSVVRHELMVRRKAGLPEVGSIVAWCSRASLADGDCLAVVEGQYVRLAGDTFVDDRFSDVLPESNLAQLVPLLDRLVEAFGDRLRPPPPPRHPDADAVARYLRKRQLVEVPERLVSEISDNIARVLANAPGIPDEMRSDWILEMDGEPTYYLPRVGDARSASLVPRATQDAVAMAIDALTYADPLGMYVFGDVWNDSTSDRPNLTEDFLEHFSRPRARGAGALRGERLRTFDEVIRKKIIFMDDWDRRNEILGEVRRLAAGLGDEELLVCEYIGNDGRMNLVHERFFWYGEEPESWAELRAQFPEELRLHRIGPALTVGPSTLTAAEAAIGRR